VAKLTPISWVKLIQRLRRFGFRGPFAGGKHLYMLRKDIVVTIPNPHYKEISVDLLVRIIKQAGISRNDWLVKR